MLFVQIQRSEVYQHAGLHRRPINQVILTIPIRADRTRMLLDVRRKHRTLLAFLSRNSIFQPKNVKILSKRSGFTFYWYLRCRKVHVRQMAFYKGPTLNLKVHHAGKLGHEESFSKILEFLGNHKVIFCLKMTACCKAKK